MKNAHILSMFHKFAESVHMIVRILCCIGSSITRFRLAPNVVASPALVLKMRHFNRGVPGLYLESHCAV